MLSSKLFSLSSRALPLTAARGIAGEPSGPSMNTPVPGPKSKALMQDLDKVHTKISFPPTWVVFLVSLVFRNIVATCGVIGYRLGWVALLTILALN